MNNKIFYKVGIVFLTLMVLGTASFLVWRKNNTPVSSEIGFYAPEPAPGEEIFVAPNEATPSAELLDKVNQLITVKPKNNTLIKAIAANNYCDNTIGLVTYHDKEFINTMVINNTNLPQSEAAKSAFPKVEQFLNNQIKIANFEPETDPFFKPYCSGSYSYFLKDLSDIKYPGTDQSRVVMVEGGQGIMGSIEVRVFARVGDNYIELRRPIYDYELYEPLRKECDSTDFDKAQICYQEKLKTSPKPEELARTHAKQLINLFALQN